MCVLLQVREHTSQSERQSCKGGWVANARSEHDDGHLVSTGQCDDTSKDSRHLLLQEARGGKCERRLSQAEVFPD